MAQDLLVEGGDVALFLEREVGVVDGSDVVVDHQAVVVGDVPLLE